MYHAWYRLEGDIHKVMFSDNRELVELLRKKGEDVFKLEAN
ncbi:BQ5605_C015g07852 [Microbotryum silenes-dioicae]|uniref:BQ5605_C015g07852 protein n=1 Tax=Microbotryum silenes-dioicae TaxID=796604 RepID=A0A2X0MEL1_9BASI|nr:BQ5605_C015g07852 [Microbotryum silenes-dioicae]